jgi:hypothetical protein
MNDREMGIDPRIDDMVGILERIEHRLVELPPPLTMTLWNQIADKVFPGFERVTTLRVPVRDEKIDNLWGDTLGHPKGYNRWVVSWVMWSFGTGESRHRRQHAHVYLVPMDI